MVEQVAGGLKVVVSGPLISLLVLLEVIFYRKPVEGLGNRVSIRNASVVEFRLAQRTWDEEKKVGGECRKKSYHTVHDALA